MLKKDTDGEETQEQKEALFCKSKIVFDRRI
jgi:hypothetical protein